MIPTADSSNVIPMVGLHIRLDLSVTTAQMYDEYQIYTTNCVTDY